MRALGPAGLGPPARGLRAFGVLAGLAAGLAAGAAAGQTLTITQMRQANVYGTVQVGPQVRPTDVTQVGRANMVGIMQAGANPRASVTQTGRANAAFIGQYENILPRGALRMP
ncbi:curlin repeat-containing protein [Methylobacterium currus]|nr:curlin repeat-containing protein [Methylobacterium currus]UHC16873.1 curlin repeat-containing protein [Methylobacterium currus]